ncbi:MAG: tetratricopeptide repeat protein [Caulobacter sp.]|nr:tetratricopeptide repeat protein [Caulobacter sp.]
MGGRILSFLLGLLLVAVGWALVDPDGIVGTRLPALALGALEGHRPFIGWGALVLGIIALFSAVLPRDGGSGGKKRRTPPIVDFDAATETAADVDVAPEPEAPAAIAAEPTLETPPPQPPPREEPSDTDVFNAQRDDLRTLVRNESWTEAAALARRLPASAATDEEHMIAARDLADFARSQGDTDDAAEAYETALSFARQLQAAAPGDVERMATVADLLTGVGDMAQDEGRLDSALDAFDEALALRRQVVAERDDARTQRALSLTLERLADAREDRGHRVRALELYRESLSIAGDLAASDPQAYGEDLSVTRRRLAELEARLAV